MREMIFPLRKLEERYPEVTAKSKIPRESSGRLKVVRMDGQATPSKPSGNPRDMKARKTRNTRPIFLEPCFFIVVAVIFHPVEVLIEIYFTG
jgi:hypothetical protein